MPENLVVLDGIVGNEVEYKRFPSGGAVANINLAVDDSYTDRQSGQLVRKTQWLRVVARGGWADYAHNQVTKGCKIWLRGKLVTRSWTDNHTGQKRYMTEVEVLFLEILVRAKNQQITGTHAQNIHGGQVHPQTSLPRNRPPVQAKDTLPNQPDDPFDKPHSHSELGEDGAPYDPGSDFPF